MKQWIGLLKISLSLEVSDRVEWDDLPAKAQHTYCFWWVGEHAAWWGKRWYGHNAVVWLLTSWVVISHKLWLYTAIPPCLKFSFSFSEIHWIALTPSFVPKFRSKGDGAPPWNTTHTGRINISLQSCFEGADECHIEPAHLLKVSQHIDSAVKDALPLWWVQPVDEICSVVLMALFIPVDRGWDQQRKNYIQQSFIHSKHCEMFLLDYFWLNCSATTCHTLYLLNNNQHVNMVVVTISAYSTNIVGM